MGKHRHPEADARDSGRNAALLIGAVGLLAIAAVFGMFSLFASGPAIPKSNASTLDTARLEATAAPTTAAPDVSESFAVPAPSFVTPSLDISLGTLEPLIPGEVPTPLAPPPGQAPPTAANPPAGPPGTVSNVQLTCSLQGRRVRAILSFTSTGLVPVTLTAGTRTESTTSSGSVRLGLNGDAPAQGPSCSATINGQAVGPVPAT